MPKSLPLGVSFTEPPAEIFPSVMAAVHEAIGQLSPDARGAMIGVVNTHGANAVVVAKLTYGFEVQAWIGKSWSGPMDYGANVIKEW
jgi:hypothetical protein